MNRGYRYTLRLGRRARLQRRLTVGVLAGFAAAALAVVFIPAPEHAPRAAAHASTPMLAAGAPLPHEKQRSARLVYPYSVVPGGVASQAELLHIVRTDKVVAAHYASFDITQARPVKVAAPRAVHVSYRKGDKVYWTSKKVMLKAGETLFTDGRNEMRARCANRVSDVAQFPVEAHEPDLALLEASFEESADEAGGTLMTASAPGLEDGAAVSPNANALAYTAPAGTASGQAVPAGSPVGAPVLAFPREGDLRTLNMPWTDLATLETALRTGAEPDPAKGSAGSAGSAPPMLVAVDLPVLPESGPDASPDPEPFIPKTDPTQPGRPDSTLVDASRPAEVPAPGTPLLLAAALTALLLARRND